ncbi:hypothetical protein [Enterobacter cloacae]|uniref:Uncharacterized protein n=1 Tax=Enterobacter cloacae TaxID=550 RepID=A0AAW6SFJ1_ENTCL|nr:hypothetical protein [Enterobacter cloacae]MDH0199144.1 hypothetical protein [Enterobacter cloacae]
MTNKTKELVAAGHALAKELHCAESAALVRELATQLDVQLSRSNALAAENAGLKAGVTYFAYSPDYGFDYFKDKQSAIDTAQDEIDAYRDDADGEDGWSDDVQRVSWGVVVQQAQGFDAQGLHTSDSRHTYQTCNYRLVDAVKTPATDAFLAEVRASGVEMLAKETEKLEWHESTVRFLLRFAAQIRKGVQS